MTSRSDLLAELGRAIDEGHVRPSYLALVDLATDEPVAVEALARWYRPSGAVVPPDDFIPAAEASGLVLELDLAIAEQAMTDLARWRRAASQLRLTTNLSGLHFARTDTVDRFAAMAERTGVEPAAVVLELTETVRPDDVELAGDVAAGLRSLGFSLWLDDFGSDRSGPGDLLHFPVDGLKIDRPFARLIGTPTADAVVEAICTIGRRLDLTVTLEGIEERRQADRARELGCHLGQGFLWPRVP